MLKIYLVQMESLVNDFSKNLSKARELIINSNPSSNSLILLPEMFSTGYIPDKVSCFSESYLNEITFKTESYLKELAIEINCCLMAGYIKKRGVDLINYLGFFTPNVNQNIIGYEKIHLFFPEKKDFTPGNRITLFEMNGFNIIPSICYDLRFSELYQKGFLSHAHLFTVHAAWPTKRKLHWETLLKARAIETQTYVASVNCVSSDGEYTGDSQIIDPLGNVILQAPSKKECVVFTQIRMDFLKKCRIEFPMNIK